MQVDASDSEIRVPGGDANLGQRAAAGKRVADRASSPARCPSSLHAVRRRREQETLEEKLVDQATAAKSIVELEDEIRILGGLEKQAKAVVASGQDRKWEELSKLLQNNPTMHDESGRRRKIIIFSEHRDTLNYLHAKIAGVLGTTDAIVTIHGGVNRDERRKSQALFRSDPDVRVLIATDAAGEGVNVEAKAEAARQLAYRLYTLCERRGWAEDARAYNEVVTGWSGIESAAAKVPSPTQGTLFDNEGAK